MLVCLTLCSTLCADGVTVRSPETAGVGKPFLVSVQVPKGASDITLEWLGKKTQLKPEEKNDALVCAAIIGTDLKNTKAGTQTLTVSYTIDGLELQVERAIKLDVVEYPSEKLAVEPKMVTPPKDQSERIAREAKLGSEAMQSNTPGTAPILPLVRPVPGVLTSVYGKSRYFNGQLRGRHGGIDMRAAEGTPIKAVADGTVVLTGDFWFGGRCVYIDHGAGLVSFYGHMSKVQTEKGKQVKAGDVIGLSGKTGRVTGPHLHFGIAWRGEYFDPEPLIAK